MTNLNIEVTQTKENGVEYTNYSFTVRGIRYEIITRPDWKDEYSIWTTRLGVSRHPSVRCMTFSEMKSANNTLATFCEWLTNRKQTEATGKNTTKSTPPKQSSTEQKKDLARFKGTRAKMSALATRIEDFVIKCGGLNYLSPEQTTEYNEMCNKWEKMKHEQDDLIAKMSGAILSA